jgi:hypothetical protein
VCVKGPVPDLTYWHGKEVIREDFPIWSKAVIYLVVGATVFYAVGHLSITIFSGRKPWTFWESFAPRLIGFGFAIVIFIIWLNRGQ